jgi:hypothetical protein
MHPATQEPPALFFLSPASNSPMIIHPLSGLNKFMSRKHCVFMVFWMIQNPKGLWTLGSYAVDNNNI